MITVYFVEDQLHRHTIGLGCSKKAVDKNGGSNRIVDRHDQHCLIYICGNDMRLFGEVRSAADDIILPFFDPGDEGGPFGIDIYVDPVSNRNWIGGTYIFQAKISFDLTFYIAPVIGTYGIPATRILQRRVRLLS